LAKVEGSGAVLARMDDQHDYRGWDLWIENGRPGTHMVPPYRDAAAKLAALQQEQNAIKGRSTVAHVQQERGEPPTAYVLFRGEYDKRRDQVQPDTPDVLPSMPPELAKNRLGFAQWLFRPQHPLAARVTVNRCWQEVFGAGIVRTAEDFGATGELPSHQDLLDWLAVEFYKNRPHPRTIPCTPSTNTAATSLAATFSPKAPTPWAGPPWPRCWGPAVWLSRPPHPQPPTNPTWPTQHAYGGL